MFTKMVQLTLGVLAVFAMVDQANAYVNRCSEYSKGDTRAICPGKSIPYEETRGRSRSWLTCSGNVDNFVRQAQEIPNYNQWVDEIKLDGARSQKAFEVRQQQPVIAWQGRVPYQVVEEWNWVDCVLGTNGSKCGYHEECHEESYSYQTCDSQNRCTTQTGSKQVCTDVANTCYYDEEKTSSFVCSQEFLTYDAAFARDPKWTPAHPDYNEFIPNKYDLMPGETEMIQVFNGSGRVMSPSVKVGDAWNNYRFAISGSGVGAACRPNASNHVSVSIITEGRIKKPSPNAFKMPVDLKGNPIPPLTWTVDGASGEPVKPITMKMSDSSSALVRLMAEQSFANKDREQKKEELGLNALRDKMDLAKSPAADPFFKNTEMRVQLREDKWYWKTTFSDAKFIRDADAVTSGNLRLSKIQALKNSDYWSIPLNDSDRGVDLYVRDRWLPRVLGVTKKALKPSQRYIVQISMYQKGVPFYIQACEPGQSPKKDGCVGDKEDVFSKPMELPFWTSKKYDDRPWWQVANEWTLVDWMHRKFRNRPADEDDGTRNLKRGKK